MARDEYIHGELLNWARWKAGACDSGLGFARVNLGSVVRADGYREAVIPTIALDAEQMDRALAVLDTDLRRTVEVMYLRDIGVKRAAELLHVAESTVKERIDRAHRKLATALHEVRERAKARLEAMQARQRAARP